MFFDECKKKIEKIDINLNEKKFEEKIQEILKNCIIEYFKIKKISFEDTLKLNNHFFVELEKILINQE